VRLLSTAQVRALEARYQALGLPLFALMEAAGGAVADAVRALQPEQVLVLAGKGNNGGDGLVAARRLRDHGIEVEVRLVGRVAELNGDALLAARAFEKHGGRIRPAAAGLAIAGDAGLVIVDALLGSGLSRPPEGVVARAIARLARAQKQGARVVSIDVPSGLDADTGSTPGTCVTATCTVTFSPLKVGLLLDGALDRTGDLIVADIGIPASLLEERDGGLVETIALSTLATKLGARPRAAFKNTFGHVLAIGGSPGKSGAIGMAALAALRTGAGLVTVAARPAEVAHAQALSPALMGAPIPGSGPLGHDDLEALLVAAAGKQALLVGPGMGRGSKAGALIRALVERSGLPVVLDADALNALGPAPRLGEKVVLTPHPGEAGRLLQTDSGAVQADRPSAARKLARATGATVVLKGAHTLVAAQDVLWLNDAGSPLLATAGSGDVLAGMVAALLARDALVSRDAAALAVALHARLPAACPGRGALIATDLIDAIPRVLCEAGL
jgi:hydroxyethylthiazole kinase-like uncharacterized protein yjeF